MKISRDNAEHYIWGEACDGWHLVKDGQLSVIHERMPPTTAEVRHYHSLSRQFFFVLSGQAVLESAGVQVVLNPREGLEIPPGVPHQMMNLSGEPVEFLVVSTPPAQGDRIAAGPPDGGL
ncbi:cupin domain-containing protein [Paenibacillus mesotrionivorans]|uniref:Cupin domain-containing protein n=1 Tax=Paenibacillus mesotrionivorans TaxID=3160968 RepID=A0ACC7P3P0_9BACL